MQAGRVEETSRWERSGFWLGAAVLMVVALGLRLWRLDQVPGVFFHDECDNTADAIQILAGHGPGLYGLDWKPQPAFAVHLIAASLWAFGPSVWAVRLPSALLSVAALVPFLLLARRAAGPLPALAAGLLLSTHLGYLHFSRTGWENVQVCLYTLVAMEAATRTTRLDGGLHWWALAGAAAGVGALTYFSGRTILVVLLLYVAVRLARRRSRSMLDLRGPGMMLLVFAASVAPLSWSLREQSRLFDQRTRALLLTRELPASHTAADEARLIVDKAKRTGLFLFEAGHHVDKRYFPPDLPLLDGARLGLLALGAAASLRRLRQTGIWWLALLVPVALTQLLSTGTPNLARGIAALPILHLFIALGMGCAWRQTGRWRKTASVLLASLTLVLAAADVRQYANWAQNPELTRVLQPAVDLEDFDEWWRFQMSEVDRAPWFPHVGLWLEHKRGGAKSRACP